MPTDCAGHSQPCLKFFAKRAVLCLLVISSGQASAGPADKVYMPIVEAREVELELRGGTARLDGGDDVNALVFDVGYGVSSRWFTELAAEYENGPEGSGELEAVEWENIFQLTEQGRYWVDVGLFAEYEFKLDGDAADEIAVGPMFQKDAGSTQMNLNVLLKRQVGAAANNETEVAYAGQVKWRGRPEREFGLQVFGKKDDHRLGPAFFSSHRLNNGNKFKLDAALLFGVTGEASDISARFQIEYEMY